MIFLWFSVLFNFQIFIVSLRPLLLVSNLLSLSCEPIFYNIVVYWNVLEFILCPWVCLLSMVHYYFMLLIKGIKTSNIHWLWAYLNSVSQFFLLCMLKFYYSAHAIYNSFNFLKKYSCYRSEHFPISSINVSFLVV